MRINLNAFFKKVAIAAIWERIDALIFPLTLGSALVWTQKYGALPPFNDVLDPETDNPYYYVYQMEPHLREIMETALSGKSILPAISEWHRRGAEIGALENGEYGLMFEGKKSVEEVVKTLDEKVTAMLTE